MAGHLKGTLSGALAEETGWARPWECSLAGGGWPVLGAAGGGLAEAPGSAGPGQCVWLGFWWAAVCVNGRVYQSWVPAACLAAGPRKVSWMKNPLKRCPRHEACVWTGRSVLWGEGRLAVPGQLPLHPWSPPMHRGTGTLPVAGELALGAGVPAGSIQPTVGMPAIVRCTLQVQAGMRGPRSVPWGRQDSEALLGSVAPVPYVS